MLSRQDRRTMDTSGPQVNGQSAQESNDPGKKLSETENLFEASKFEMGVDAKTLFSNIEVSTVV